MNVVNLATVLKSSKFEISPSRVIVCHGLVFAFSLISLVCFYMPTLMNLIHKYSTSGTYAHGFIVYPLVAWMIYNKREAFHEFRPNYEVLGLISLFILSLVWYVANLAQVGIIQQFCFISMIISLFITCFGIKISKSFLFPLSYLLFAIPFGNFLTPTLQNMTAHFAVYSLELTGIPVFYEGWQISTSSGDFEVAEACSGIRYLIATLALGVLFAYFTYQKMYKRVIFSCVCVAVPLIANGIRAYFIILIAHYSKMKYAVGVDHLIYGWIFFGFIIFLLFTVGAHFRDETPATVSHEPVIDKGATSNIHFGYLVILILTLSLAPSISVVATNQSLVQEQLEVQWPEGILGWQGPTEGANTWGPDFKGPNLEQLRTYRKGTKKVDNFVALYFNQTTGSELITESNQFYSRLKWSLIDKSLYAFEGEDISSVVELNIHSRGENRLIWYWYVIGGVPTTNPVWGKILEGYSMVRKSAKPSGVIVLSAEYDYYPESARIQLESFAVDMGAQLMNELFKADE